MALKGKYKIVKGEDGKFKLLKNDIKVPMQGKPLNAVDKEALEARLSQEKKRC